SPWAPASASPRRSDPCRSTWPRTRRRCSRREKRGRCCAVNGKNRAGGHICPWGLCSDARVREFRIHRKGAKNAKYRKGTAFLCAALRLRAFAVNARPPDLPFVPPFLKPMIDVSGVVLHIPERIALDQRLLQRQRRLDPFDDELVHRPAQAGDRVGAIP